MEKLVKARVRKNKILIVLFCLSIFSCTDKKTIREDKLIDDYHKQAIDIKGDSLYFVSKETVENFLMKTSSKHSINQVKISDNISFLDKNGNIVYQAICVDIKDSLIYVDCLNLQTKEEYTTDITIDNYNNISDLKKFDVDTVFIFRE